MSYSGRLLISYGGAWDGWYANGDTEMVMSLRPAVGGRPDHVEIADALRVAAAGAVSGSLGPGLRVEAMPELRGAIVSRCCVEVLVNTAEAGFGVECWQRYGSDSYSVRMLADLDEAVRVALLELDCEADERISG